MLITHRSEGTAALADALGQVLADPLVDPFAAEIVAVPAKGVERWLTQRLSMTLGATAAGDGVTANIVFPSPTRLVEEVIAAALGTDPDDDPWATGQLVWTVLEVLDGCLHESWCSVLREHLQGEQRVGRRYATAEHLTRLFRDYGAHRPLMLVDWASGTDTDVPPDLRWQPQFWREVRLRIGAPSPAERLEQACRQLRDHPEVVDLPRRLSLFGPTRITTEQLEVLRALAAHRDVHLWLPHPSRAMWQRLAGSPGVARRQDDVSAEHVRHPLLATLARDVRELQQRLPTNADQDRHHGDDPGVTTLLSQLRADLAADQTPSPYALDDSVQVHACHGPPRQVEVLRELLLQLFDADPTLEPRDVLVLCPDVETYAPLVRASFGQGLSAGHPGHRLRVRLADRSLRQTNPLLDAVAGLLDLADGRVTASQVLDLAAQPAVRRRFSFDDDDLERLRGWAADSGVRWGIGRPQRAAFGLDLQQNTWETGLDRLLLGVTADESSLEWLGMALPLDDVDSSDIDLAGRLAELVDRLSGALHRLTGPQPARLWAAHLSEALGWLTDVAERDSWQLAQARRELAEATEHAGNVQLRLPDVRAMLATRLAGRPTRANFRTGDLTVCTMVPMRSVPHRVVVLLGLDDEVFPRGAGTDGDDVLARDPRLGERDLRSEDRQLLLDALTSASDRLVVLYTGADPVSGQRRPPAVPLGELVDVLVTMTGRHVDDVVVRHPLQPFDAWNFQMGRPFSYDTSALEGARAAASSRVPEPAFLDRLLPEVEGDVSLDELVAFVQHPVQAFLSQRLGLRLLDAEEPSGDALEAELDPLRTWSIGDRWLEARLSGLEPGVFQQAEWRRGTLPPGRLGMTVLQDLEQGIEVIVAAAVPVHVGPGTTVDVAVELGGGRRLTGSVAGVHGSIVASTSYSRLAGKHRLRAWVRLLALAATAPGRPWQAVTTGRGPSRRSAGQSTLVPPPGVLDVLRNLVALRDAGLREPLPVAPGASAVYALRRAGGDSADLALHEAGKAFGARFGDVEDRHLRYVHGPAPRLGQLTGQSDPVEGTRFGALARRLWDPLLAVEKQEVV